MKYENIEILNINSFAKKLILQSLLSLEDDVHKQAFGGLDIRSDMVKDLLKNIKEAELTNLEADMLIKEIKFEVAKVIGKLETQTGIDTGLVKRNSAGHVARQQYDL
jgi:hypothetical protein